MTIKKVSIEYDALNSKNVFTNGDTINGRIIVKAFRDRRIRSLVLTVAGKATVHWNEDDENTISQEEVYYGMAHYIIRGSEDGGKIVITFPADPAVIVKGRHVFPFSFKFPDRNVPTSFESRNGRIFHELKVELKWPKRLKMKAATILNFVSKTQGNIPRLMNPQHDRKMKTFRVGSGHVLMDVYTAHQGYKQGEDLLVTLIVANNSGRMVRPMLALCQQQTLTVQDKMHRENHKLLKKNCKVVKPNRSETVTKVLKIPDNLTPSILNCSIVHLEYWLKVYLDIPFARKSKIKLPIVLLPSLDVPTMERPPASAAAALQTFGSSIQRQRSMQQSTLLPEEPPPAYETL